MTAIIGRLNPGRTKSLDTLLVMRRKRIGNYVATFGSRLLTQTNIPSADPNSQAAAGIGTTAAENLAISTGTFWLVESSS